MSLSLKVLGTFSIRDASGAELSLPTKKTRALLGYLAVNADKPQPRERLMELLWSDRGKKQARQSLNHALKSIRRLGSDEGISLLVSDGERVTLRGEMVDSDVVHFRRLLTDDPASAAAFYRGPLLDGLTILDPVFDEWLVTKRSELHVCVCDSLQRAAETAADRGDTKSGIEITKRLVALDPLREDAQRRLMQLLHQSGDRIAALRQYQSCAEILRKDLSVEPDLATRTLFEGIKRDSGLQDAVGLRASLNKPSIAVLAFDNLSSDPEQEYFADGIAEDIISSLSKLPELLVIARNSSFTYKGMAVNVQQVGEELGVRYVLEGSVRKAGKRVRITTQLIDCHSGGHLWAAKFDRELRDVFAVQDEVTRSIVSALALPLTAEEQGRLKYASTDSVEAYDCFLRGRNLLHLRSKEGISQAKVMFKRAADLDPNFSSAYSMSAVCHLMDYINQWHGQADQSLSQAYEFAQKAVALDETNPRAHEVLGNVTLWKRQHDRAVRELEVAIALEPSYANAYIVLGWVLHFVGKSEEGIKALNWGVRLDPLYPDIYLHFLAQAHFQLGRYEEASELLKRRILRKPDTDISRVLLAASYGHLGRTEKAQAEWAEALRVNPNYSLEHRRRVLPYKDPLDFDRIVEGLKKACLPA